MRIWLIGADQTGTEVLRQLKKNPTIDVIVSDAIERPKAVMERVIAKVDYVENVSPINLNQLARRVQPDLILIDASAATRDMGRLSGGHVFAEALQAEMVAGSEAPCLVL
jgi:hypothetical protein